MGVRGPTEASERGGILSRFGKDKFSIKAEETKCNQTNLFFVIYFFPNGSKDF